MNTHSAIKSIVAQKQRVNKTLLIFTYRSNYLQLDLVNILNNLPPVHYADGTLEICFIKFLAKLLLYWNQAGLFCPAFLFCLTWLLDLCTFQGASPSPADYTSSCVDPASHPGP